MDPDYRIDDPDQILSPGLVVFRPLVRSNIEAMIALAGGPERLRPHCKTHKMPAVARMELERGILKHKGSTLAEAEMLAGAGVKDILLTSNLVGPHIARGVRFRQQFPDVRFSVTADHPRPIRQLGEAMAAAGLTVEVLLDIDSGRNRTGLPAGDAARDMYELIARTPGLVPGGLHVYDGHQHQPDLDDRRAAVLREWEKIIALRDELVARGAAVPRLVCGSTPTCSVYAELTDPTIELSPGTCVFFDCGYGDTFADLGRFRPAALVLTRVISRPTPTRVTFDAGTKAVASDPPMGQRVRLPDLPESRQVLQNEEHLVVETPDANRWQPGDATLLIPRHVCPTSALYKQAYVIDAGRLVGMWDVVARDRQLTI